MPWFTSLAAIALYVAIIAIVQLPGYSYQTRPAMYPFTFWENLTLLPTTRGILLNIVPVAILSGSAVLAWKAIGPAFPTRLFRPIDVLVVFEMALVAMIVTHEFQMGRLVDACRGALCAADRSCDRDLVARNAGRHHAPHRLKRPRGSAPRGADRS